MIAICPNPFRDNGLELTCELSGMLKSEGIDSVVCPIFSDNADGMIPEDVKTLSLIDAVDSCTMAIVIGGDGTMLSAARSIYDKNVPMLGINLGTKGFMAALERESLDLAVAAAKGEMSLSRRMMIDVCLVRDGEAIYSDCALNDAVIHGYGECITMTAWADSDRITKFSGDGIIIATPTGSTGYSMSAGGPIIEPDAENMIISPICAHMMSARSFVLSPKREIRIQTEKLYTRKAYLSVDGGAPIDVMNNDILVVKRSEHQILMSNPGQKNFYEIVYTKLT